MERQGELSLAVSLLKGALLNSSRPVGARQWVSGLSSGFRGISGPQSCISSYGIVERSGNSRLKAALPSADLRVRFPVSTRNTRGIAMWGPAQGAHLRVAPALLNNMALHLGVGTRGLSTASSRRVTGSFFLRNHIGFVSVPHQMAYVVER